MLDTLAVKYLKLDRYIVSIGSIHGIMREKEVIFITYDGGASVCLEFNNDKEKCQLAFDKLAEALGSK